MTKKKYLDWYLRRYTLVCADCLEKLDSATNDWWIEDVFIYCRDCWINHHLPPNSPDIARLRVG